jgi:peptidoglycan/LPS O-acetylase OafA/YrhL
MQFEKIIQSRDNNFNFVRLTAALSVVLYHACAGRDPISDVLSPISNLGEVVVGVFFLLSGIFVIQSWLRDPNLVRFFIRRAVRILPALFVCVTATTLIAVTFFSQQGIAGLVDIAPWTYIA